MTTSTKQHRYLDIADSLRTQIRNGDWGVGDRLPSLVEMYREHGATISTMQKVYDLLEKEELIERRSRSGVYVASPKPKQNRGGGIALALPYFQDPEGVPSFMASSYAIRMLRGMHEEAVQAGFQITLGNTEQIMNSASPVDGLLFQGDSELVFQCSRMNKPKVALIVHSPGLPSVGIDDFESSKAITNYLWEQGHRHIAALLGGRFDEVSPLRIEGYRAALTEKGTPPPASWHHRVDGVDYKTGYVEVAYAEICRWLREDWTDLKFTALVTQNDAVAVGAIRALRDNGLRVPEDVSVVGFDNAGNDWQLDLKLTSVEIPLEEIGRRAVAMLREIIDDPTTPVKTVKLPTKIIEGASTINISGRQK
jgi:DNA-binding LacI/PurR family transcriptional regulator